MTDKLGSASANAVDICRHLLALWKSRLDSEIRFQERGARPNFTKFLAVHGLCAHTYRVGEQALAMYETGMVMETFPLLRLSYESALTAHWIAQNVDGSEAVLNNDVLSRRAAAGTLSKAHSEILRSGAQDFPGADKELIQTSSQAQVRNFEQLCQDLEPGGADAYAYYRLMSWYSHPTARIIDSYLQPTEDMQDLASLRLEPEKLDVNTWVHFLAFALVWAARSLDFLDADRTHRSELRKAARDLGIPEVLKLSEKARQRTAKAEQARRRASWKGPKQDK